MTQKVKFSILLEGEYIDKRWGQGQDKDDLWAVDISWDIECYFRDDKQRLGL